MVIPFLELTLTLVNYWNDLTISSTFGGRIEKPMSYLQARIDFGTA